MIGFRTYKCKHIEISTEFVKCPQKFQILQFYPFKNLQPILIIPSQIVHLLGPTPIGIGTITLDLTFATFTLLKPISH
jgi:hypothetical protein